MALTVADCPFCEIVLRDDPDAREVYTDKHVVAFFPTEPAVLGHTMVFLESIWRISGNWTKRPQHTWHVPQCASQERSEKPFTPKA